MPRKNLNTKIDVAVIKNDLNWIKDTLKEINTNMKSVKGCVDTNETRIQSLEDWKKFNERQFNKNMAKWGLVIAGISIVVSFIIAILV